METTSEQRSTSPFQGITFTVKDKFGKVRIFVPKFKDLDKNFILGFFEDEPNEVLRVHYSGLKVVEV